MSFYSAFPTSPLSRSALAASSDTPEGLSPSPSIAQHKSPAPSTQSRFHDSPRPDPSTVRKFASRVPLADAMPSALGLGHPAISPHQSSRHVSGPARLTRSPAGPSLSPTWSTAFDDGIGIATSPPFPSSSFARSINARRRSSGCSFSAVSGLTPTFGSLVGSFQESLLSGRMSMPASKPLIFDAEIGVLATGKCRPSLRCPPHVHVKFPAHFYDFHAIDAPASSANVGSTAALGSPYVGTIDLESHYTNLLLSKRLACLHSDALLSGHAELSDMPAFPGYAVPPKGQIQLIVKYPDLTAVKLFLVPYDLTDMQPGTKTFVRQKTIVRTAPVSSAEAAQHESRLGTSEASPSQPRTVPKEALRFAIHLQFCCPPAKPRHNDGLAGFDGSDARRFRSRGDASRAIPATTNGRQSRGPRIYLHKTIRLVFGARALDSSEKLVDHIETPGTGSLRFSSYQGPDEEWQLLHEEVKALQRSTEERLDADVRPTTAAMPLHTPASFDGLPGTEPVHTGLGIDIQASALSHRMAIGDDASHENLVPLNSDPNGERWQASVSSTNDPVSSQGTDAVGQSSTRSTWSISSQESSLGPTASGWPAPQEEQHEANRLAQTLASSHLSDTSTERKSHWPMQARPAAPPQSLRHADASSSLSESRRPLRLRSASAAGLSEPRIHNVSALGQLQETARPTSPFASGTAESAHPVMSWKSPGTGSKAGGDRPSLLRKLSEQFARSHTPSPTHSPRLAPTQPPVEQDEMRIDDGTSAQLPSRHHSRSIR